MYKRQPITKAEFERLYTSGKFDKLDYEYIIPSITDEDLTIYKEDGVPIAILIDGMSTQGIREIFYFEVSNEEVGKGHGTRIIAVILAVLGFVVVIAIVKIKDVYKSYCWDKVTVIVTAVSLAIIVWFVDLIKAVMPVNAMIFLLSVQMLYVPLRWYIHGCRLTRGYY